MLTHNAASAMLFDKRPMVIWEGLIETGRFRVVMNAAGHLIVEVQTTKDAMGQHSWQAVVCPEKKAEVLEQVAIALLSALHDEV